MNAGDIYRHDHFYRDAETGELKRKYLVLLARLPGGDWVAALLTSQQTLRSEDPQCNHADPRPGYFLGVPGDPLTKKTWIDLRVIYEIDSADMTALNRKGIVTLAAKLSHELLVSALECAAGARDTTTRQERAIRDLLAAVRAS